MFASHDPVWLGVSPKLICLVVQFHFTSWEILRGTHIVYFQCDLRNMIFKLPPLLPYFTILLFFTDAAKRKALPAWIREGLEKMEREKQKKLEKEQKARQEEEDRKAKELAEKEAAEELEKEKSGEPRVPRKSRFVS